MRALNKAVRFSSPSIKRRRKLTIFSAAGQRLHHDQALISTLEQPGTNDPLFHYTSGRWLYDEQLQLERRYVKFNVEALRGIAGELFSSRCVEITKLPEGLYNKVFSLKMENGKEILARIPNPNAGRSRYVVASEVATLDFLRNVLDIPVPEILGWSSTSSQSNIVGTEYIMMERAKGRQLSEAWPTMSEAQRFGLVKSLVEIEKRLTGIQMANYGSLYYRDTYPDGWSAMNSIEPGSKSETISKFVIGPTTERSFWVDERQDLNIDRGPWRTTEEYITAFAKREIALVQNLRTSKLHNVPDSVQAASDEHIRLLNHFLAILPYILPPKEIASPVLLHHDLHPENIFVDNADPTKISSVIDWQAVHVAPLFLQARFPSVFDCDDPYTWGAVQPKLPDEFDNLPQPEKELAEDRFVRVRLKKFYELASRKFNPVLVSAMDAMRNDADPITFIFHIIGQSATDGSIPLRELLVQIYEKWDHITERKGLTMPCPISFSDEEIKKGRQQAEAWAEAYTEFDSLQAQVTGKDGWVSHDGYEKALHRFESHKETLDKLRERLQTLS